MTKWRVRSVCASMLALFILGLAITPVAGTRSRAAAAEATQSCTAGEVVSLRTRDSSTFRNADCSYTGEFGSHVHYLAAPGQWEDVDLQFRQDGTSYVADRNDVVVRVAGATVEVTVRATGKGIRWITPGAPAVHGQSASYSDHGLTWQYANRPSGIKLTTSVASPQGAQTYEFPYQPLGGAAPLVLDPDGNLVGDGFAVH